VACRGGLGVPQAHTALIVNLVARWRKSVANGQDQRPPRSPQWTQIGRVARQNRGGAVSKIKLFGGVGLIGLLLFGAVACSSASAKPTATSKPVTCDSALAADNQNLKKVRDLYPAIRTCASFADFGAALQHHPSVVSTLLTLDFLCQGKSSPGSPCPPRHPPNGSVSTVCGPVRNRSLGFSIVGLRAAVRATRCKLDTRRHVWRQPVSSNCTAANAPHNDSSPTRCRSCSCCPGSAPSSRLHH
jgi:hypothetical protein